MSTSQMASLAQALTSQPVQFYASAPDNNQYMTASSTGTVTLQFDPVPSGHVFTGSITVIPQQQQSLYNTQWTVTRDGSTPFLIWYGTQVGVDIQARDGQTISLMGTGLIPGSLVRAVWTGRNDPTSGPVPVVSPTISGSPSYVGLIRATGQLGSSITNPITNLPNLTAVTVVNAQNVTQPGYEAEFSVHFSSGVGTSPFVQLIFTWIDSLSGLTTKTQYFYLTGGNGAANTILHYLYGPCFGDTLTITATNTDASAGAAIDNYVVNQTSHVYTTDKIVQPQYTSVFGFTNPDGVPAVGVIGASNPGIAPSSSVTRLLAVYSGRVGVSIDNLGGANALRIRILDPTGSLYSAAADNKDFYGIIVAATSSAYQEIAVPRGPVTLEFHNQGATGTITPAVTVVGLDY